MKRLSLVIILIAMMLSAQPLSGFAATITTSEASETEAQTFFYTNTKPQLELWQKIGKALLDRTGDYGASDFAVYEIDSIANMMKANPRMPIIEQRVLLNTMPRYVLFSIGYFPSMMGLYQSEADEASRVFNIPRITFDQFEKLREKNFSDINDINVFFTWTYAFYHDTYICLFEKKDPANLFMMTSVQARLLTDFGTHLSEEEKANPQQIERNLIILENTAFGLSNFTLSEVMGSAESYDKYIDEANKLRLWAHDQAKPIVDYLYEDDTTLPTVSDADFKAFEAQAVKKRIRLLEILLASIESRPKMSETETKQGPAQE